ncbi:hypothetical protein PBI_GRAVY_43 [Gordonia phage Gravy]|uniref:Uncharacterized protein n=5 Tax=Tanisvirus tanis TaxID=2844677 RepID=A0A2P1JYG0_9CAUD|nr:hypothetical protein PBI_GRAVY_43 [Gordonia phage Gravy]AVO25375.1 hypothetical protein PBI_KERRY_43 [Gordonia phage Kerry]QKY78715.1 membrane protein [Gordonia phage Gill]
MLNKPPTYQRIIMRKATLIFSALSFVTSVATLGVLAFGAKRVHNDIQEVRAKTNDSLQKMKVAMLDIQI